MRPPLATISRRAVLQTFALAGLPVPNPVHAISDTEYNTSPRLIRAIADHAVAYAAGRRNGRLAGSSHHIALTGVCRYEPRNDAERFDKATYLLPFWRDGELGSEALIAVAIAELIVAQHLEVVWPC